MDDFDRKFENSNSEQFCTSSQWNRIKSNNDFDYVVVGTGPCGLGFIDQTFKIKPNVKILMLERGDFYPPKKITDRTASPDDDLYDSRELFPWQLSKDTANSQYIKYHHGTIPGLGGGSTEWRGWCPQPTREELTGWPEQVVDVCEKYFDSAEKLLGVVSAGDEIRKPVFNHLQRQLFDHISKNSEAMPSFSKLTHARIAYDHFTCRTFCTTDRLMELIKQKNTSCEGGKLCIVLRCVVQNINHKEGRAVSIMTSRGDLPLQNSTLILAMGAIPSTTLLANSFPSIPNVGAFFGAHFKSRVLARISQTDLPWEIEFDNNFEFPALYIAGNYCGDKRRQFHVQLSAFIDESLVFDKNIARYAPSRTLSRHIQKGNLNCDGYVTFCLSALGEVDVDNPNNSMKKISTNKDKTSNLELNISLSDNDHQLWKTMDDTMFHILEDIISMNGSAAVDYWHGSVTEGGWCSHRPPKAEYRHSATMHETSTLMIGDEAGDRKSVVGLDYRPYTVENVYVTGGGLFPRARSWNPTLTMTALSIHLADSLNNIRDHL